MGPLERYSRWAQDRSREQARSWFLSSSAPLVLRLLWSTLPVTFGLLWWFSVLNGGTALGTTPSDGYWLIDHGFRTYVSPTVWYIAFIAQLFVVLQPGIAAWVALPLLDRLTENRTAAGATLIRFGVITISLVWLVVLYIVAQDALLSIRSLPA
jgi:hypothetical protein